MTIQCAVHSCKNAYEYSASDGKRNNPEVKFFRFPKEKTLREIWVSKCTLLPDGKVKRLCSDPRICYEHFRNEDIIKFPSGKWKLEKEAIPSRQLVQVTKPLDLSPKETIVSIDSRSWEQNQEADHICLSVRPRASPSGFSLEQDPLEGCSHSVKSSKCNLPSLPFYSAGRSIKSLNSPRIVSSIFKVINSCSHPDSWKFGKSSEIDVVSVELNSLQCSSSPRIASCIAQLLPQNLGTCTSSTSKKKENDLSKESSVLMKKQGIHYIPHSNPLTSLKRKGADLVGSTVTKKQRIHFISPANSDKFSPNTFARSFQNVNLHIPDISPNLSAETPGLKKKAVYKKRNVYYIKKTRLSPQNIIDKLRGHLSPLLLNLIKLELNKKTKKQNRYSPSYKQYALSIRMTSRACYRLMRSVLPFPCEEVLRKWIQSLRFSPGIDPALFSLLRTRAKFMEPSGRFCFILIDEMNIKENLKYRPKVDSIIGYEDYGDGVKKDCVAKSVLVFMARGVIKKWKQPLAFVFTAGVAPAAQIEKLMMMCISNIENAGFTVLGICTDQGANFHSLFTKLQVTVKKPYFKFNGKKRLVIVDPPHLIKSTRNALLDYNIQTPNGIAKWEPIVKMYNLTKTESLSVVHRLTEDHLNPPKWGGRMKVKLSSQVLSLSVASALETCLNLNLDVGIPNEAYATADYCRKFNDLFDICNSSTLNCIYEPNRSLQKNTDRYAFLKSINDSFLEKLVIINPKNSKPIKSRHLFIKGWQQTVNAIILLMDMLEEHEIKTLQTRSLCQDPLENFFGQNRIIAINPDCYLIQLSFGELCFNNLLQQSLQSNTNCEKDNDNLFLDLQAFLMKESVVLTNDLDMDISITSLTDWSPAPMSKDLLYQNTINYVGGYLLFKLGKIHKIEKCGKCSLAMYTEHVDPTSLYTMYKTFDYGDGKFASMKICSRLFLCFIDKLEQVFSKVFDCCHAMDNLGLLIKDQIKKSVQPFQFCDDKWLNFVVNLFVRLRIFREVKLLNRKLAESKKNKRSMRKLKILQNA